MLPGKQLAKKIKPELDQISGGHSSSSQESGGRKAPAKCHHKNAIGYTPNAGNSTPTTQPLSSGKGNEKGQRELRGLSTECHLQTLLESESDQPTEQKTFRDHPRNVDTT